MRKTAFSLLFALLVTVLSLPGHRVSAQGLDRTTVIAAVPFDFYRHEVVVEATINGQGPFPMLLDTGTSPSLIDTALARTLGLTLTPLGTGGSGGGTEKNETYGTLLPSVGIGGFNAANVDSLAMDLSELSRHFGRPIRGVLGQSLLSGTIVQFDYPAHAARFLTRLPPAPVMLPFQDNQDVQINAAAIDGKPACANIDTGSNSMFQITAHAVRRLGLTAQARRAKPTSAAGFNGAYSNRVGTVDKVTIGPLSVSRPEVTFWMPGTGHDSTWDINVGNVFLQHYVVTIDYVHKRIAFK